MKQFEVSYAEYQVSLRDLDAKRAKLAHHQKLVRSEQHTWNVSNTKWIILNNEVNKKQASLEAAWKKLEADQRALEVVFKTIRLAITTLNQKFDSLNVEFSNLEASFDDLKQREIVMREEYELKNTTLDSAITLWEVTQAEARAALKAREISLKQRHTVVLIRLTKEEENHASLVAEYKSLNETHVKLTVKFETLGSSKSSLGNLISVTEGNKFNLRDIIIGAGTDHGSYD